MSTIYALSTPPGKSGVAVIRVSGEAVKETLCALGIAPLPVPRVATLATLYDGGINSDRHSREGGNRSQDPRQSCLNGGGGDNSFTSQTAENATQTIIDKALILYFPAPHSFTGEDVLELHVHGSRAVIQQLFGVFSRLPFLRPAEPGEFTRRAFLNGKMDLTAAEGLSDLIDAETEAQKKQALRHMQGEAAEFFGKLRSGILHSLAFLEAYIDFPDEDIPESVNAEIDKEIQNIIRLIEHQLADKGSAGKIRDGINVAIVGPPNVGKSSLMNLLAGRDVAIVSHIAGTTRDVIEVHLDIKGYCVILSDTAGIREHADEIEKEGIRRTLDRAEQADIRIVVVDKHANITSEIKALMDEATILLLNKSDLALPPSLPVISGVTAIPISVKKRDGIDAFMRTLESRVATIQGAESSFVTRSRHRRHLDNALLHLQNFTAQRTAGIELRCEELRRAATEIGKITGIISVDELLGHIFASFCIGK